MKTKISIIVPVYMVEKYLKQCIESILGQTFQEFELLLIDDGSTDTCGEICDEYQRIDSRVKVWHQINKGVSAARNLGLQNAQGEYIAFVDSDDWLEPNMYEVLYEDMQNNQADISICNHSFNYDDNRSIARYKESRNFLFNSKDALKSMLEGRLFAWTLWNMLYKRSLFNGLKFDEKISIGEDLLICFELFKRSNRISYNHEVKYHYRQRDNSACSKCFSVKSFDEVLANKVVYQEVVSSFPELQEIMFYRYNMAFINAGIKIVKSNESINEKHFRKVQNQLRPNVFTFLNNKYSTAPQKLYALTFALPYFLCCTMEKYILKYLREYKNNHFN